jgi:hypothetical protein
MEVEQYEDVRLWLSEFIGYGQKVEFSIEAQKKMASSDVNLSDVYCIMRSGRIYWADRDHSGCLFAVKGRNCDDDEITVFGRFEAATLLVVVDDILRTGM